MATIVKHGPTPDFGVPLQPGTYHVTVTGHYTTQDGMAAAGVTEVAWHSDRAVKRQAELLSLRSAFIGWFIDTYLAQGGTWREAVACLRQYPYPKVRASLAGHPDPAVRKWAKEPTAKQRAPGAMAEARGRGDAGEQGEALMDADARRRAANWLDARLWRGHADPGDELDSLTNMLSAALAQAGRERDEQIARLLETVDRYVVEISQQAEEIARLTELLKPPKWDTLPPLEDMERAEALRREPATEGEVGQ